MTQSTTGSTAPVEHLVSLKVAAQALGLPYFKLQRAARDGLIPTYRVYNSRKLVRLSEVLATIDASRTGVNS